MDTIAQAIKGHSLASFKKRQSGVVVCALGGALLGLLLFSIPAAILVGIGSGCAAALFLAPPVMAQQGEKSS